MTSNYTLNLLDVNFGWIREHLWSYSVKRGDFCELEKGRSCVAWERPTNVAKVKNLLGLASYYRQFVEGFSMTVSLLSKLTRKHTIYLSGLLSVNKLSKNSNVD